MVEMWFHQEAIPKSGPIPEFPKLENIVATAWVWHKKHPTGCPD
jgi:hypothetical protein